MAWVYSVLGGAWRFATLFLSTMLEKPFQSDLVLDEIISKQGLRAYTAGFEQNAFRLQPLVDLICDVIPEFTLGYHAGTAVPLPQLRRRLKEAATRVYTTDKYKKRGEFGELILHLLLRDYFGSVPLISKINFKDSDNATVHGFDGVHIVVKAEDKQLWLGESKLYQDGAAGVKELAKDLMNHLQRDYLKREFSLIETKLPQNMEDIEFWRRLLHEYTRLDGVLDRIVIPMACTYSSDVTNSHSSFSAEFVEELAAECEALNDIFLGKKVETEVDVILLLLPVKSKPELVDGLHAKLKAIQAI